MGEQRTVHSLLTRGQGCRRELSFPLTSGASGTLQGMRVGQTGHWFRSLLLCRRRALGKGVLKGESVWWGRCLAVLPTAAGVESGCRTRASSRRPPPSSAGAQSGSARGAGPSWCHPHAPRCVPRKQHSPLARGSAACVSVTCACVCVLFCHSIFRNVNFYLLRRIQSFKELYSLCFF